MEVNSWDDASVVKAGDTKNSSYDNLLLVGKGCFSCVLVEGPLNLGYLLMTVDVQSYFPPLLRLLKEMGYLYVQAMEQHFHFPNGLGKAMHDGYDENLFLGNASGDQEGNYSH